MRFRSSTVPIVLIALCASFSTFALKLEQGTLTLGGHMTVPFKQSADGRSQISFREEPPGSLFVADNLRLVGSFEIEALLRWSDHYPLTPGLNTWGGKIGAEYVFPLSSNLFVSTGLRLGIRARNALFDSAHALVQFPVSLWWAINENAALEEAFPGEFEFSKQFGFESFSITTGYFGLIAFI